jgi:hypothetical protein
MSAKSDPAGRRACRIPINLKAILIMAVSLQKGGNVSLSKEAPGLSRSLSVLAGMCV